MFSDAHSLTIELAWAKRCFSRKVSQPMPNITATKKYAMPTNTDNDACGRRMVNPSKVAINPVPTRLYSTKRPWFPLVGSSAPFRLRNKPTMYRAQLQTRKSRPSFLSASTTRISKPTAAMIRVW